MIIIDSFFWIAGIVLLTIMLYLWFLAVVSLLPDGRETDPVEPVTRFGILVPAFNEANIIEYTLKSIKELDYPAELLETVIIADNCTDKTAEVCRGYAIHVLERSDEKGKGKGFALQWGFRELRKIGLFDTYSAFVVVDADAVLDSFFLKALDKRLQNGECVIQGSNEVMNPEGSITASLYYLGYALSRRLKYHGRSRLNWSANLLGNGMCFKREIIQSFQWRATSIVEDLEYAAVLNLNGIRIYFAPEARNYSVVAETFDEGKIQRSRWDTGKLYVCKRYLMPLIRKTFRDGDMACFNMILELIIPPFSLFAVLITTFFSLFALFVFEEFDALAGIWACVVVALFGYILLGLVVARGSWRIYMNLVYAPFYVVWRIRALVWGYFSGAKGWEKTARRNDL
jgi:cellulose synthase/poly-beta-1,6-N-acetylglucosamine synthase-like glycosyltransferase